jgi:hypothetical protein
MPKIEYSQAKHPAKELLIDHFEKLAQSQMRANQHKSSAYLGGGGLQISITDYSECGKKGNKR